MVDVFDLHAYKLRMYLIDLYVKNNGPLRTLKLTPQFAADGKPIPLVLVGGNGSGKTGCLSSIADALFEAAAAHFTNAVPGRPGIARNWFRIIGPATITLGQTGSVVLMKFKDSDQEFSFKEKGGTLDANVVLADIPEGLASYANWPNKGAVKEFGITSDKSKEIFNRGVYTYFPSSRSEQPHWMNSAVGEDNFDMGELMEGVLKRPIFVERGIDNLKTWILDVVLESRCDINVTVQEDGQANIGLATSSLPGALMAVQKLGELNQIIRIVLGKEDARFVWLGRNSSSKLGVADNNGLMIAALSALSAGQATLLSIFGNILKYADVNYLAGCAGIEGICLIDEIDAHMHISLQHTAIPLLIAMFPKIQFLLSTHSPLCVLGLQKALGAEGVCIIDMPSGARIDAEQYNEFEHALRVLKETQTFRAEVESLAGETGKMLVLMEGETDPLYMKRASILLGFANIVENVEFEWIGAKDPKSGQGFFTGKTALSQTANILKANPNFIKRPITLLHDNDTTPVIEDLGNLHIRALSVSPNNTIVEAGIENLLSEALITPDMFEKKVLKKKNGTTVETSTLRKMELCMLACSKDDPSYFEGFRPALQLIDTILPHAPIVSKSNGAA